MEINVEDACDLEAEEEEENLAERASWHSLFNFTSKRDTVPFLLALASSVAAGIIAPALAVFLGSIFDLFTRSGAGDISGTVLLRKVSMNAIILAGLGTASGLLHASYFMLWLVFGELQGKHARERLFGCLLEKDMGWFDMRTDGIDTLLSRSQTQVRDLQLATSKSLGFAVQDGVTVFAALSLASYYSWGLTIVILSTVPILAVLLAWNSSRMQPSIESQMEELTKASSIANDAFLAIDTVKCFNRQDFETWQYRRAIERAARCYLRIAQASALQIGGLRLITLIMFVQGFWFGSRLVNSGQNNPGDILTAFWACLMATQAFERIQPEVVILENGRAAGAALKCILDQMEDDFDISGVSGGTFPLCCPGDVVIRDVSFSYPSRANLPVLKRANIHFPAGETTFVVGRSGSGKSTLGNLLMRFYSVKSGEILIDGRPIHTLDIKWLRNNVTYVQQQSVLFSETLFKNIALGQSDHRRVRKEEVIQAIETARLQHTINDLPQGLETVVGSGGNALSGGQKQRVAIARARLRDTPILILDEATSALDHVSKCLIVDAIRKWRHGKTTIIITHDLSQVQDQDFAYVLDAGSVIQKGLKSTLRMSDLGPFQQREISTEIASIEQLRGCKMQGELHSNLQDRHPLKKNRPELSIATRPLPNKGVVSDALALGSAALPTPSQSFISVLSPTSAHRWHVAGPESTIHQRRSSHYNHILDLASPLRLHDVEAIEMTESRSGVIDSKTNVEPHYHRLPSPMASPMAPRVALSLKPQHEQRLTKAERVRRVAPMRKILMTVWPALTWDKRIILILSFLCAAVHAAATPTFSWVFSKLLATFYLANRSERSHMAQRWSLTVLGIAFVDSLATFSTHFLLEYCGRAWVDAARVEALKRILDQPRSWFDKDSNSVSRLTECLDRNAEEMRNLLGRFAGYVFVASIMGTMAITWSLILSWKLTVVGLASAPFMYVVTRTFEIVSGRWEKRSNDAATAANAIVAETFVNIRTVRALTLETYMTEKYTRAISKIFKVGLKRAAYSGLFFGLSESAILFLTAAIFYYGAVLVSTGAHPTDTVLSVFTMLLFSISQINNIVVFIPQIASSRDTAARLLRLAHLPRNTSHEHTGHIRLADPCPITFTDLSFAYPSRPTVPVLTSLSLTLDPSTTTALVGASGSGKSTLASLILALYPPTSGSLTINNIPIPSLHIPTLRSLIALVPQHPILTTGTIASNISYGAPTTTTTTHFPSILAAAKAANIHSFIRSLPYGYDTPISSTSCSFSGGQIQRLAIARALYRKPKLIILDEATSALDEGTKREIRETLGRLRGAGVGVVVVTHERGMMEWCGEVVVMKGGRVVERGAFGEVVGRGGELARLLGGGR